MYTVEEMTLYYFAEGLRWVSSDYFREKVRVLMSEMGC